MGESWDLVFLNIFIFSLLNLSENTRKPSAEARTDKTLKLQLSSCKYAQVLEGEGENCLCFYKTSLEKSENTLYQARVSDLLCPFSLWNREGVGGRTDFRFRGAESVDSKTEFKKYRKGIKGKAGPLPVPATKTHAFHEH